MRSQVQVLYRPSLKNALVLLHTGAFSLLMMKEKQRERVAVTGHSRTQKVKSWAESVRGLVRTPVKEFPCFHLSHNFWYRFLGQVRDI